MPTRSGRKTKKKCSQLISSHLISITVYNRAITRHTLHRDTDTCERDTLQFYAKPHAQSHDILLHVYTCMSVYLHSLGLEIPRWGRSFILRPSYFFFNFKERWWEMQCLIIFHIISALLLRWQTWRCIIVYARMVALAFYNNLMLRVMRKCTYSGRCVTPIWTLLF